MTKTDTDACKHGHRGHWGRRKVRNSLSRYCMQCHRERNLAAYHRKKERSGSEQSPGQSAAG